MAQWREIKRRAIEYMGGSCSLCGYSKCDDVLQFHHVDPSTKSKLYKEKGHSGLVRLPAHLINQELDKCVMLCANCHAEVHAGFHGEFISNIKKDARTEDYFGVFDFFKGLTHAHDTTAFRLPV